MKLLLLLAAIAAQTGVEAPAAAARDAEVIVFSDFQCPFCAQFSESLRELQMKGIDGVPTHVEFRHFPLAIHPDARLAHRAAVAAGRQGKFWEMHDLLFANQSAAKCDDLVRYAASLGLDISGFRDDLDSERFEQVIQADVAEGERRGVRATPTFFINGKSYVGTRPWRELKQLVEAEFRRTRALTEVTDAMLAKGTGRRTGNGRVLCGPAESGDPTSRGGGGGTDAALSRGDSAPVPQFSVVVPPPGWRRPRGNHDCSPEGLFLGVCGLHLGTSGFTERPGPDRLRREAGTG